MNATAKDWRTLPAGVDLNREVEERVFGRSTVPPRGYALAIVGMTLTSVTGKDWRLRNGRVVYMPEGDSLPQPEGTTDYNARYYAYAAEHSGEDVDALVAMVRHTPPAYSTDIAAAWRVVELMEARGFRLDLRTPFMPGEPHFAGFTPHGVTGWNGRPDHEQHADTPALAIARAALAATEAR